MSVDERGSAAAEDLLRRVSSDVDARAMLRSVRRTRTRRRVAMVLPVLVVVGAAALAIQVPRGDKAEGPSHPSTPTPSNGALVASNETGVVVLTGHLDHLPQDVAKFSAVQFIKGGSELVYVGRAGGLESINVTTGNVRVVTACRPDVCPLIRVSPDGTRAAMVKEVAGGYGVQVRNLATGQTSFQPTRGPGWLQWSPDGGSLAMAGRSGIDVMDVSSGDVHEVYRYPTPRNYPLPPSWSPDGTTIAFLNPRSVNGNSGATDWTLTTVDVGGAHVRKLRDVGGCYCIGISPPQVAWSPDGQRIAISMINGNVNNASAGGVHVINPDGTGLKLISSSLVDASGLAWQPRQEH